MASISIHGSHLCALTTQIQPSRRLPSNSNNLIALTPLYPKPNPSFSILSLSPHFHRSLHKRSASAAATEALDTSDQEEEKEKKLRVVVKGMEKPRLVLKFIWMEKNIGLALDQVIPGHGSVPLSPYYFWPRKDAWEELKSKLEEKPWISQKRIIILLNQATDIMMRELMEQAASSKQQSKQASSRRACG